MTEESGKAGKNNTLRSRLEGILPCRASKEEKLVRERDMSSTPSPASPDNSDAAFNIPVKCTDSCPPPTGGTDHSPLVIPDLG